MKKKSIKRVWENEAVIWICRMCGAYNLHPIEWGDFDCISCGTLYYALADSQIIYRPK